jgi:galactose oxidase-like protein
MPAAGRRLAALAAILLAACSSQTLTPTSTLGPGAPPGSAASPSLMATESAEAPNPTPGPASWSELSARPGPAKREDHTWTLAGDGQTALLFGGRAGQTVYDDLWAYDLAGDAWTRLTPVGPAPPGRFGHNAAWVDGIGLVVFAGQNGADFYNDLWAYDPTANGWRQLPAIGALPVARYGSCAAIGPDGRLWISHGFTSEGTRFADTRAYDFELSAWTDETPRADLPVNRCLHSCWWTTDRRFVLYGGSTTGVTALGDAWALRSGVWTELGKAMPPARNLYAAAKIDPRIVLVFGGQGLDGGYLNDAWLFEEGLASPVALHAQGSAPPARSGAEMVLDPARRRVLLFGGKNGSGPLGDEWELDLGG